MARYAPCAGLPALAVAIVLAAASPVRALDPGLKEPYQLQIVLHIADNRFLTPIFQEQIERELRDHLQLTFGTLAKVEVVRAHPLLGDVRAKGLHQALDGWEELSDRKTHFVTLDYVDGRYELQARQHDGKTGLNSPVVRRDSTGNRRLVVRKAAQLVERDFGLVGTVVKAGKQIEVALQGGALGVPLNRWLQRGDIFAIARITQQGNKQRATRLPWAVLQVIDEPRDGVCRCEFFYRFQGERLTEGSADNGYRCLKLTTTTAPLRLRFLDDKTFEPLDGLQVHAGQARGGKQVQLVTNADGLVISNAPFPRLAIVQVVKGGTVQARFPVEVIDDRTVICRLRVSPQAESLEALECRKDLWVRRIYDDIRVADDRVADLNRLLNRSLESSLGSAREGFKVLDDELDALTHEGDELRRQASAKAGILDLREGDQRCEELRRRQEKLKRFIGRLENAIKEAQSDETRARAKMVERARLLESEAEYDHAIALYEKVLELSPGQAKVREHLDQLKKDWSVKGDDHARARAFLCTTWPRVDPSGLKEKIPEAKKAFVVCRDLGDRLAIRKLYLADSGVAGRLKKRLDVLKRQDTADNRDEARNIAQTAQALSRLHAEAGAYLRATRKK